MSDATRKLLKLFGVTVTDFEAEADRLVTAASTLSADATKDDVLALLRNTTELCREMNQRWMEITTHVYAAQDRLLVSIVEAAARAKV